MPTAIMSEDSAKYHFADLLNNGATAILCGNDLLAIGILKECQRLHIKVPKDISIVGFDNLPISAECTPALTTISQDRIDLGKSSYAALYWLDCQSTYIPLPASSQPYYPGIYR